MTILQFADKYLGEHRLRGKEINVKKCPFCGKEKWKFYLSSTNGKFKCHSGSCGQGGTFLRLQHKFGIQVNFKESISNDVQTETVLNITPEQQKEFKPMSAEMYQWWDKKRGISKQTLDYMRVCQRKGNIALPYLQENELKMMKYRDMIIGKDKKVWQEAGGMAVLWGLDKIKFEDPVILSEGEPDMLSWIEAGYYNVVSVPFGTDNLQWINNNLEQLKKIKELYICFDDDPAGRKATINIKARLNEFIKLKKINLGTYNDVNEALVKDGKDKLIEFYEHAEEFKEDGYYYADQIEIETDLYEATKFISSFDKNSGGFRFGEVIVWSAYTGSGKTTLLAQMALKNISQNYNVCYYSGEDSKEDIMTKIALQLYGEKGTKKIFNPITQEYEQYPTEISRIKIKKDLGKKLIIIEDEVILNNEQLKSKFQSALTKDDCRIFILDNLMQIDILKKDNENKNELQKNFLRELVRFARKNNIQIHLVAHNKKPDNTNMSGKTYDVSGASEIVNLAHMVIGIDKLNEKRKEEIFEAGLGEGDAMLNILKKRKRQGKGKPTLLKFDNAYSTFYNCDLEKPEIIELGIPEIFR